MADLSRQELQQLARLGAKARLEELRQEEAAIRRAFPGLFAGRGRKAGATSDTERSTRRRRRRRKRPAMSAAQRRAVSERMTKYWAEQRKGKKKSS